MVKDRYKKSNEMLRRTERVIPLGSQTFSKSRIQFPVPHAPLYLERGKDGRVWDVDGNEYVDLVCGLLAVTLGYGDEDVNTAITKQLEKGISFSLATELEAELAERLVKLVPSAQMVRFGKNGTDATSAAIRLARAFTKRDHVIACGYHGWQDWYIGATTRKLGVPEAVQGLTHKLPFNDIEAVKKAIWSRFRAWSRCPAILRKYELSQRKKALSWCSMRSSQGFVCILAGRRLIIR
jgi:glutamate-1-semialdehyde 2,1-aminomutase